MREIIRFKMQKKPPTLPRWQTAVKDKAPDKIRHLPLLETRADQFLPLLTNGKVSTNAYLQRIHNFGLATNWLPVPVIAKKEYIAFLDAKNIDWENKVVSYSRTKTGEPARVRFGDEVAIILCNLPEVGFLFPYLRTVRALDRATEFKQRCVGFGITGVTLHSYRHAWLSARESPTIQEVLHRTRSGTIASCLPRLVAA